MGKLFRRIQSGKLLFIFHVKYFISYLLNGKYYYYLSYLIYKTLTRFVYLTVCMYAASDRFPSKSFLICD